MKKEVSHEDVKEALKDVHPDHHFHVKDGAVVKNLHGLYNKLQHMDEATFSHHVNDQRNDFHSWILHIVKDKYLADEIAKVKHRAAMITILKKRLDQFESVDKEHRHVEKLLFETHKNLQQDEKKGLTLQEKELDKQGKLEKDLDFAQLREDLAEVSMIESMGAGNPVGYGEKPALRYGFVEFIQGVALGLLLGILLSKAFL